VSSQNQGTPQGERLLIFNPNRIKSPPSSVAAEINSAHPIEITMGEGKLRSYVINKSTVTFRLMRFWSIKPKNGRIPTINSLN